MFGKTCFLKRGGRYFADMWAAQAPAMFAATCNFYYVTMHGTASAAAGTESERFVM